MLQDWIDRLNRRPVVDVEKHHGTHLAERLVVVLGGVLEDLLDRARATGSKHHTSQGDGQQAIFTDAVGEIFGDLGGKNVWGFVAVMPGRYTQA